MNNVNGGNPADASARVLTTPQAAAYLQVSKSYLEKARQKGDGPDYFPVGRSIRYRTEALDLWVRRQERRQRFKKDGGL